MRKREELRLLEAIHALRAIHAQSIEDGTPNEVLERLRAALRELERRDPKEREDEVEIVGTPHDVTARVAPALERRRIDEDLRRVQNVDAIGTLAGGVVHELNNVLYVILGNAELGLKKISPESPAHKNLSEILAAARRGADVIHRTLQEVDRKPVRLGRESVLFVDDEPRVARLAQEILESLGYSVEALTSSRTALERFRAEPERFDVVVTDQTMPHLAGDVFAREILRVRPDTPIVLCTGVSENLDGGAWSEIGIHSFLRKPFGQEQLGSTVRRALDERRGEEWQRS